MADRESIRWSLRDAEAEFPIHRDTLSRRLHQLGEQPAPDGTFSTQQICAGVYGDKQQEQARLAREQADRIALDNEERRKTLINVEDAKRIARRYVFAARQRIVAEPALSDEAKNVILADLRRLREEDFTKLADGPD